MPYCPKCHSEYRPEFVRCAPCEVELVAELPELDVEKAERLREAVKAGTASAIVRASYTEACQMVESLQSGGIDSMVTGDPNSCGKGGGCSHFFVAVLPEDAAPATEVLRDAWMRLVKASEEECGATAPGSAVDFDAEGTHTCPACATSFEGEVEECPECGLFLGAA